MELLLPKRHATNTPTVGLWCPSRASGTRGRVIGEQNDNWNWQRYQERGYSLLTRMDRINARGTRLAVQLGTTPLSDTRCQLSEIRCLLGLDVIHPKTSCPFTKHTIICNYYTIDIFIDQPGLLLASDDPSDALTETLVCEYCDVRPTVPGFVPSPFLSGASGGWSGPPQAVYTYLYQLDTSDRVEKQTLCGNLCLRATHTRIVIATFERGLGE